VGARTSSGNAYAGRNAAGDLYAGSNGNVYRNNNGNWQRYNDGKWNSANIAEAQQRVTNAQQQRSSAAQNVKQPSASSELQGVQRDFQNRQRGAAETQRVQSFRGSGGVRSGGGGRRR
jgi:hypothetical protein